VSRRRVAVTGLGVVSPLGHSAASYWDNLKQGNSGLGPITLTASPEELTQKVAAEVKDFDPLKHFEERDLSTLDRVSQFAVVAARGYWYGLFTPMLMVSSAFLSGVALLTVVFYFVGRLRLAGWRRALVVAMPALRVLLAIGLIAVGAQVARHELVYCLDIHISVGMVRGTLHASGAGSALQLVVEFERQERFDACPICR